MVHIWSIHINIQYWSPAFLDFLRHGDFMYVFGGYDGSAWLNDMFDFDFERGAWLGSKHRRCCQQKQMTILGTYPLVMTNIAIENGHKNSGFTHEKWWFSIVTLVYQRVIIVPGWWFGTFLFFHMLGMSSSQLTFIFFRGVGIPPTSLDSLFFQVLGNTMKYMLCFRKCWELCQLYPFRGKKMSVSRVYID